MNRIIKEDMKELLLLNPVVKELENSTVLLTGATGLIGRQIVNAIFMARQEWGISIQLAVIVRNHNKVKKLFKDIYDCSWFFIYEGDIRKPVQIDREINYIIHCASNTSSRSFIEEPAETIDIILEGTKNLLNIAREKRIRSMIYLSSMEVYGFVTEKKVLKEENCEYLDTLSVRSSYPLAKRMAENMCVSYLKEYGVPAKIIRLAQTFGAGVDREDTRVFAEFARCAAERRDIKLLTDAKSERMYLYTADAVSAVFQVLMKGENGQAYNAAFKESYCSILEMAGFVKSRIAGNSIHVRFIYNEDEICKFSPPHFLFLDTEKLERLGWAPHHDLYDMFQRMIDSWE